ncbi:MAG: 2-haloacid dehalogenase [Paracoccaceae bacterium]|jgi:2-haloacid dehalogenase
MTRPEIVLFDIGNVLIEWKPEQYFDTIMPVAERKRMFAEVDLHAMNDGIDRGGKFRETVFETADKYPEFRDQIRQWHAGWLCMATPAIPKSAALNSALRAKGIHTAILSNIGRETYQMAAVQYPFLADFDRHFISAKMGSIKPEPEIYDQVERTYNLPPDRLLFTDDRLDNINAARARGWKTHHFTDPDGWAHALVAQGLLTDKEAGI